MIVHVIIGCDGEVFATLLSASLRDIEAARSDFERSVMAMIEKHSCDRAMAMAMVVGQDFSKELDPDAEAFTTYLEREYGMDRIENDTFHLPN